MRFLTMNVYMNAWLDCSRPFISIHNRFDDDVLLHLNTDRVNQLIDSGDICVEDFQTTDTEQQMKLITNLLAHKSSEKIKHQLKGLQGGVKRRASKTVADSFKNQIKQKRELHPVTFLHSAIR